MEVSITVAVENRSEIPGIDAEHGLAFWIRCGSRNVLFDTGQGELVVRNSRKLGLPLSEADAVALSHGHYDHTGGLAAMLRVNVSCPIFAHSEVTIRRFSRRKNAVVREIGMPAASRQALMRDPSRWKRTDCPTVVVEGIFATGPIPRVTDFENTGGPFFLDREGQCPDLLNDDQALFFDTHQGTVVVLGCAHAGVINTLLHIRTLTNNKPVFAVIGGMHLVQASSERLRRTIYELRRLQIKRLAPAHCTGSAAVVALQQSFPSRCVPCHVGSTFQFELSHAVLVAEDE
jgi:7,8-dihydropterin-6-yl-methyl-4-(beta-D-ribofuranosyl)aminobenzene 5'-phosphate synthase